MGISTCFRQGAALLSILFFFSKAATSGRFRATAHRGFSPSPATSLCPCPKTISKFLLTVWGRAQNSSQDCYFLFHGGRVGGWGGFLRAGNLFKFTFVFSSKAEEIYQHLSLEEGWGKYGITLFFIFMKRSIIYSYILYKD